MFLHLRSARTREPERMNDKERYLLRRQLLSEGGQNVPQLLDVHRTRARLVKHLERIADVVLALRHLLPACQRLGQRSVLHQPAAARLRHHRLHVVLRRVVACTQQES